MTILEHIQLEQLAVSVGSRCLAEALSPPFFEPFSSVFLVSQQTIWDLHGERFLNAIAPVAPRIKLVDDGETTKNLAQFERLLHWLAGARADRKSVLIALGGGVVGDLSGFVAAAYMRGIAWVYVPTTLLAQQDASVGGKVGVNLPRGKNLVGHFWSPRKVVIDSELLATLPEREVHAGFMELLKHGMLQGEDLYRAILAIPSRVEDWAVHLPILLQGLRVKIDIVTRDPFEAGPRRLLNLGHTLGHAIESYTRYRVFLHGEAVGLGLVFAAMLAGRLGGSYPWPGLVERVKRRLPSLDVTSWNLKRLLDLTRHDKKGVQGVVAWIVPFEPGKVKIVEGVSRSDLKKALADFVEILR